VPTVTFRLLFVLVILEHDVDRSSTSRSPIIRPRRGLLNSFAIHFPRPTHRGISCTIAIRSLQTWRPPSRR
jgi:hypothetical protein